MTRYNRTTPGFLLLLVLFVCISCNGQNKTPIQEIAGDPLSIADNHPKLIRTQGTNQYANVHCGLQDKAGDLWFGTTGEGVYRFDGKSFTNYTVKDGLNDNNVWAMLEDKSGIIWFGTKAGLCRYDGKNFTSLPVIPGNGSSYYSYTGKSLTASKAEVWSILQDKKGNLWFGTSDDGVYCYDGTSFTHFLHGDGIINKNALRLNAVNSMVEDKDGNIWFATWFEGVCFYDGKSITSFKPNDEIWFYGLLEDKKGNIWTGRRDRGVVRFDAVLTEFGRPGGNFTNVRQHGVFDSCGVGPMLEDKSGNIWFCTEFGDITRRESLGGVWRYNPSASPESTETFTNFTSADGLSNNAVFSVTADKSGKLWFGTRNMGLCSYDGKSFTSYSE